MLSTREYEPGKWVLLVYGDRAWALIDILRINGEVGYKAVTAQLDVKDREVIGYYRSFKAACSGAHLHYRSSLGPKGNPANLHDRGKSPDKSLPPASENTGGSP